MERGGGEFKAISIIDVPRRQTETCIENAAALQSFFAGEPDQRTLELRGDIDQPPRVPRRSDRANVFGFRLAGLAVLTEVIADLGTVPQRHAGDHA
ncbi:hypothetical protein ASE37_22410 [Rhizobium sp. Root268]|nr:hypothetical protein ASC86_23840 [Rhizobium sp. Root1212]KRD34560.1 hypothetical protein ASE37_22410 [Rhizobium sp. Root268]